ncbi:MULTISPECIES: hypothetical protein [unclassified Bradyrhizobium]|uniref:hypothetical protein n=1 Tax=unclassified Bradyrhizobium TaxID=2631580 RepID=UPI002915E3B1|nr:MULTISPECIES: hypothetical protein [unclassified Bradyrhizobium]
MLARAFFRLCALEALRPSALLAADGPWPTLAGKYVSDSRIDPIDDHIASEERRPLIGVYTEGTRLHRIAQSGPLLHKADVDLVFEISVVSRFADSSGTPIVDFCETDGQTEAALDALESQIYDVLHDGPTGALFRKMGKGFAESWHSEPRRSGEEDIKLAHRKVTAGFRLKESYLDPPPVTQPADLARLPAPLQSIAAILDGSTYLADLVLGLARSAFVMPNRVPLNSVSLTATPQGGVTGTAPVQGAANNLQG